MLIWGWIDGELAWLGLIWFELNWVAFDVDVDAALICIDVDYEFDLGCFDLVWIDLVWFDLTWVWFEFDLPWLD